MNLADLELLGVLVKLDGAELVLEAPTGVLLTELIDSVRHHKGALLAALQARRASPPTYGTGRDTYGRPLAPLVQCGDCQHYIRNAMNPEAGIGRCQLGEPDLGGWPYHPGARRCCESYNQIEVSHAK